MGYLLAIDSYYRDFAYKVIKDRIMIIVKKKDGKTFRLPSPCNLIIDFNVNERYKSYGKDS